MGVYSASINEISTLFYFTTLFIMWLTQNTFPWLFFSIRFCKLDGFFSYRISHLKKKNQIIFPTKHYVRRTFCLKNYFQLIVTKIDRNNRV